MNGTVERWRRKENWKKTRRTLSTEEEGAKARTEAGEREGNEKKQGRKQWGKYGSTLRSRQKGIKMNEQNEIEKMREKYRECLR